MAVETILIPVAKQILGKAANLASDQIGLLWNFRRELNKLNDTVTRIQAVLRDAEKKQFHSHQVKDWLEKLSDVMYDADDVLDDLATEACREALLAAAAAADDGDRRRTSATTCWSVLCFLFSSLPKQLVYDLKMAHAIKAIREKLDDISRDKESLELVVHPDEEEALPSFRETDSRPPTIVVGRDDDKKKIIDLLLNSNAEANISVVPIAGMGGLGKTTLAQLVFDDNQVKDHFDLKVWVYVSQSFDVKVILRKMLQSIDRQSQPGPELDDLQAQLQQKIKGYKFLFVLDDVWEESNHSWETLGKYLTVGAPGSKVLVTTRSTEVASIAGGALKSKRIDDIVEPYPLKGLSEEESWKLLEEKAHPRKVPTEVQDIGKQILRQCGGVPLAVSTIAGTLVHSIHSGDPKTEWPSLLQKGVSSIIKGGKGKTEDPTMRTLQVSFNHLPSHMKRCFTYCALFGKGSKIQIPMLVRLWVAQGYIESEDEGYGCFKTLWWRSFFQEVEMDKLGDLSTCGMHDLMHDLADTIAGETIKRSSSSTVLRNVPSKSRHLWITRGDSTEEVNGGGGLEDASKVWTLICFRSLSNEELEHILNNFLRLRVLIIAQQFHDKYSETSLHSVGKLKHLRYLGFLRFDEMRKLPDSVTKLVNLQVLDLSGGWLIEELPRDAKKLVNLKRIELDQRRWENLTHIPDGIGELKSLQTLPVFVVGRRVGAGLDELKELNELRGELTIKGLAHADSPRKGVYLLKEKLHLQSLVLAWGRDDVNNDDIDDVTPTSSAHDEGILEVLCPHPNLKSLVIRGGYQGVKLPNWLSSLTNLVEFSLKDCERCEYLPPQMHQMSCLKKLTIEDCPLLKGIINNDDSSEDDDNDDSSEDDDEWPRFDCLSYLRIRNCPSLTQLPTFPTVEGELEWEKASLAPFARTMRMKMQMRRGGGDIDTNVHPPSSSSSSSSSSSALVHPLSKLTKLKLDQIDDDLESLSLPDSSSCLVSLEKLNVVECSRGVKLPASLCSSIYLTKICILGCASVEYLPPLHELPSLRTLQIGFCSELKGCWWKKKKKQQQGNNNDDYDNFDPSISMEGDKDEEEEEEWPHFPCLSELWINRCPKLTRMPLFPTVEGRLVLSETSSAEALVRTMKMKLVVPLSLGRALVTPLSKLTDLWLAGMEDLECLPEEGLRNLTSLGELQIEDCPRLATLPPAMRYLTSLQQLSIEECPLLRERCSKGEGEDWPNISHIPTIQLDWKTIQGDDDDDDDDDDGTGIWSTRSKLTKLS